MIHKYSTMLYKLWDRTWPSICLVCTLSLLMPLARLVKLSKSSETKSGPYKRCQQQRQKEAKQYTNITTV